jgi:hypothetical protein
VCQLWKRGEFTYMCCGSQSTRSLHLLGYLAPLRGTQLAVFQHQALPLSSVPTSPSETASSPPATVPKATPPAVPRPSGPVSNAVEYVVTKVDDLINYARKVRH